MTMLVRVSNFAKLVNGDDKETLFQLWMATKDIARPYRITRAPRTGDGDLYIIEGA